MLNMNEIEQEIEKLENSDYTTLNTCKNLAILYIVRDHLKKSAGRANMEDPMMRASMMRPGEM